MHTERRTSPRLPVSMDVVLNHRAQSVIGTVRDISLGGAFVAAEPELLPFAGDVEINFSRVSRAKSNQFRLHATIERTTEQGAAISFGDVGQDAFFQLVDLVTSN